MTIELLRRRFVALAGAFVGGAALPSAAAAEGRTCYALVNEVEDEWNYVCGDSGKWCDLRKNPERITVELGPESRLQQPSRGSNAFGVYFKDERPITETGNPPPASGSARNIYVGIGFTEVEYKGRVTNWGDAIAGWKDFRLSLVADGKEIGTAMSRYSSGGSLPLEPTAAALRGTREARAALFDAATGQLVVATKFSTKGFGAIYDEAVQRFNSNRAWLVAGNTCIASPPAQPCYFTTAACGAVGLPDDCFELTMMRRLRDRHLASTARGRAEVAQYYSTAPRILNAMTARSGSRLNLLRLYWSTILPGALLVRAGMFGPAHRLYRHAMRRLEQRYRT